MDTVWYVYMLSCADGTLYTGVTTDLERRLGEHNTSSKGARYTRPRRPVSLVYSEQYATRSEATKRESVLKNLSRTEKLLLAGLSSS
jgi:putative endonuclease